MTLNEKILATIEKHGMNLTEENTVVDDFSYQDLANQIELLLLQEQVNENESILDMAKLHMDTRATIVIENRIYELNNKINQLNK